MELRDGAVSVFDDAIAFGIVAPDQNEVAIARRERSVAVFDDAIVLGDVALRRNGDATARREDPFSLFDDAITLGLSLCAKMGIQPEAGPRGPQR
jgi:hypothetical protein